MYSIFIPQAKRKLAWTFLLIGLGLALAASACDLTPTPPPAGPTPSPAPSAPDLATGKDDAGSLPGAPSQPQPGSREEAIGAGSSSGGPGATMPINIRYQWVGQIVLSDLRGTELATACDTWALKFSSPEVESKAVNNAGNKLVVWGTPNPISARRTIDVEAVFGPDDPRPEVMVPEYPCGGSGGSGGGVTGTPMPLPDQLLSWSGVVIVSDLEGAHLELDRGCDAWVLLAQSDDVAAKLKANVGKKLTVWGVVSTDPNIYMRPTISVRSAHGPDDMVIALYVPEYPCGGVVDPVPPMPRPAEIDLLPGEIAAVGSVVEEGGVLYLETPSGRILLKGDVLGPPTPPPSTTGEATAGGGGVAGAAPSYARAAESLAVGKWLVEDGRLVMTVRYLRDWGVYVLPQPYPVPQAMPVPPTEPGKEMGVLYGQVRIGPLCPVEPCSNPTSDVYSSRSLVLEGEDGTRVEAPLGPDGWFKLPLGPGVYVATLTNCDFLGCKTALPRKVEVIAGEAVMLEIDIDTGIR